MFEECFLRHLCQLLATLAQYSAFIASQIAEIDRDLDNSLYVNSELARC